MTDQVLLHMKEIALNLALYAKLETRKGSNFIVKMQKSLLVAVDSSPASAMGAVKNSILLSLELRV